MKRIQIFSRFDLRHDRYEYFDFMVCIRFEIEMYTMLFIWMCIRYSQMYTKISVYNLNYTSYRNSHLVYDVVYVSEVAVYNYLYSRYTKRLFVYDVTIIIKSII